MIKWRSIIVGIVCGILFESVLYSPVSGFYLLPILLTAVLYVVLPFTVALLNIGIAWLSGVVGISIFALVVTRGLIFSLAYFVHLIVIITFSTLLIYASSVSKK